MNIREIIKKNTLLNSAIWYTIGTFILKGVNFFTTPIFTNLLNTDEYGVITVYSTWTSIFAIIVGIGINGTIGSARANLDDKEYREYLSSTLFLGTLSFLFIASLAFLFKKQVEDIIGLNSFIIIILLFESFFSFVISFATSVFTFERNHKMYLFTSAIITTINVITSILLILSMTSDRYRGKIFGGAIATIMVGTILYIRILYKGKKIINLKYWRFCLPIALPLIFHNLSHLILNQADKIMLQKFTNSDIVGVYGFTYNIAALLNTIQIAVNSAWMPWYFDNLKSENKAEIKRVSAMYISFFTILTVMFILGVPEVVKLFSPKEYWSGIKLMPIVIAGYYFVYLYTFPANYQFFIKQTKFIAVGTIVAAVLNIIINYILIPIIGMYGAAIATLLAYVVLFFMHFSIVKVKYKHKDFPFVYNMYGILTVAIASLVTYVFLDMFLIRWIIILLIIVVSGILLLKNFKAINESN